MAREKNNKSEHWDSNLGVVLAVAGSAVGLGNFLRFPGLVAIHGGAAFMIPYFISLLIVALPIAWSEWALGRFGGRNGYHSLPGIYRAAGNRKTFWTASGGLVALVPLGICMFYIFVEAWCLLYALQYLGGCLRPLGVEFSFFPTVESGLKLAASKDYTEAFNAFIGAGGDGALFQNFLKSPLLWATLICATANFTLVYCGIAKGIERFCKIATPLLLLCAFLVIIRVATLGNPTGAEGQSFVDGLGYMWNPTRVSGADGQTGVLAALANPSVWLAATSHIFFSASLCVGAIATYASYVKPKKDIALSSLTAVAANCFCEVALGGLMTVPAAIMFLGFLGPESFKSSFTIGFIVLPNVFGGMPGGEFFGFFFFSLLFIAGITSSVSQAQPAVAWTKETLGLSRGPSVLLTAAVSLSGTALVCWYTKDAAALDAFDFWIATFMPFVVVFLQTALVAWIWGANKMTDELDRGGKIRVPRCVGNVLKYLTTPYLTLIFLFWLLDENGGARIIGDATSPVWRKVGGFLIVIAAAMVVLTVIAAKRWRVEEEKNAQDGSTDVSA